MLVLVLRSFVAKMLGEKPTGIAFFKSHFRINSIGFLFHIHVDLPLVNRHEYLFLNRVYTANTNAIYAVYVAFHQTQR